MEERKSKAGVGILTFHCADNYGAMLQAYGLKQFLCGHDIKAEIVPYEPPYMTGRHWWIPYIPIGGMTGCLRFARSGFKSHRRMGEDFFILRKRMKAFRKKYLLSKEQRRLYFSGRLKKLAYTYYIVGSDQIWNPEITCGLRREYFGAFENKKKEKVIAYAASMGGASLADKYDAEFSKLLESVDAVSTREESAIQYISRFCDKKVTAVLDPVFLLDKKEWEKIENAPETGGYILVHMTERVQEILDYARRLSEDKGLPVIELRTNTGGVADKSFETVYTAGPAEFLGYIHKADYVVTNSFHMTAFSIIYQKKFVVFLHTRLGARIRNILEIHGLEDRLYKELYKEGRQQEADAAVDWAKAAKSAKESIKESESYLLRNLLKVRIKKEECCGCGACAAVCNKRALHMISDDEGFRYPYINPDLCVQCGRCEKVCPIENGEEKTGNNLYFAAQAKNNEIRYTSSSGGVFSVLAQFIFRQGGLVFGAGYNKKMEVVHQAAGDEKELERIKRTKYVQSNIEEVYQSVEERLKEGRWVLFCGTPCQARSLELFLGRDYERLVVADLICYGVPSPGMWKSYVKYLEQEHGGRMTDFSFRDKRNKDNGHVRSYIVEGVEYTASLYEDLYCRMYFTNYTLRPSCHNCRFCTTERDGDFTIGDFWGIENVKPDADDGMGTSLVILHTDKAKDIWMQIRGELNWFACERSQALQPRLLTAPDKAEGRESLMKRYMTMPFDEFISAEMERRERWRKK